jgi:hypothetical protein
VIFDLLAGKINSDELTYFFSAHAEFDLINSNVDVMPDNFSHLIRTISVSSNASNKFSVLVISESAIFINCSDSRALLRSLRKRPRMFHDYLDVVKESSWHTLRAISFPFAR